MERLKASNTWNGNGKIEGLTPGMGMETLNASNSWNGN